MPTKTDTDRNVAAGLLVIGSLLVAGVAWIMYDSYQATWLHAVETSSNLATTLQREIGHTIESYDLSLQAAIRAGRAPELPSLSPLTRHQLLFDGAIETRHIGSVYVLDTSGAIVDDSSSLLPRAGSFADRDFFIAHRDHSDAGLYISKPFKSRLADEWSIAISRRINGPHGEFAGIAVGAIRFSYFAELFSKLKLGADGAISLFNLDGTMLYRNPFSISQIGRDFTNASLFRELRAGHTTPYEDVAKVDGIARLFAFSIVDGLPLVLTVNTSVATIYAEWTTKAVLTCIVFGVLLVLGYLLARAAQAEQQRRLAAERQTARSATMLHAFFDHSPDALFVVGVGPDGRLSYESCNRACAILTGVAEPDLIGKTPQDVFGPEMGLAVEQRYRTCIESGQTYSYEQTRFLPGGRRDWQAVLCPVQDDAGVVTLMIGSARDMTERDRRIEDRHNSHRMEAVGRLTAGVAHDFNNHLQTISSSLEILKSDYLGDEEAVEFGELAQKAATRGARLTHHLLAVSGQQVLRPRRLNVAALLGRAMKTAGGAALAPGIQASIVIESFTDDIQVDPAQLETSLLNLLANAREAMPDGGSLVLHARNVRPDDGSLGNVVPENLVIIAIRDTGPGMDEATRLRAFEPFFTTKTFGKGAGLGLSMVQGFCQQSGGEIRICDGHGSGTWIELWLPSAAGDPAGEEISANFTSMGRPTGRALLVADEEAAPALLGALVSGGFETVAVASGQAGLARLGDPEPYDVVIGTAALPDMAGADFLAQAVRRTPDLAKLLLADHGDDTVVETGSGQTVTVLHQPVRPSDLLAAVRQTIDARPRTWAA